jgi:hypothetical protein
MEATLSDPPALAFAARAVPAEWETATPLLLLAWNATKTWSDEVSKLKRECQAARAGEVAALVLLADTCFRLRGSSPETATQIAIRRLEQGLEQNAVEIVAPQGAHYSGDLVEVLESVERVDQPGLAEAVVHEVLTPAIRVRGDVVRLGKAVIAVPADSRPEST